MRQWPEQTYPVDREVLQRITFLQSPMDRSSIVLSQQLQYSFNRVTGKCRSTHFSYYIPTPCILPQLTSAAPEISQHFEPLPKMFHNLGEPQDFHGGSHCVNARKSQLGAIVTHREAGKYSSFLSVQGGGCPARAGSLSHSNSSLRNAPCLEIVDSAIWLAITASVPRPRPTTRPAPIRRSEVPCLKHTPLTGSPTVQSENSQTFPSDTD